LSDDQLAQYHRDGYIFPIRALSEQQVADLRGAIDEHLSKKISSERYELTDPVVIRHVEQDDGRSTLEYDEEAATEDPDTFPFLFNLWKYDERFRAVGFDTGLAGIAAQILGTRDLLLMEDNAVVKYPRTGTLPWHQDYSYWPLEKPNAVTVWIALDHVSAGNGAMQVVPGSHKWGERLPVSFGEARSFMHEERPGVPEITQDPAAEGHPVVTYELEPGECGFHSAMVWHASTPNSSDTLRAAFVLRYLASGTTWLGGVRFPYDDVGCKAGDPIGADHFPVVPVG